MKSIKIVWEKGALSFIISEPQFPQPWNWGTPILRYKVKMLCQFWGLESLQGELKRRHEVGVLWFSP